MIRQSIVLLLSLGLRSREAKGQGEGATRLLRKNHEYVSPVSPTGVQMCPDQGESASPAPPSHQQKRPRKIIHRQPRRHLCPHFQLDRLHFLWAKRQHQATIRQRRMPGAIRVWSLDSYDGIDSFRDHGWTAGCAFFTVAGAVGFARGGFTGHFKELPCKCVRALSMSTARCKTVSRRTGRSSLSTSPALRRM